MVSKTDYGLIILTCFAIVYTIVGISRLFGYAFSGRLILGCAICSVAFATISILETLVSGYKQAEKNVISKIPLHGEGTLPTNKYNEIHENYTRKINLIHKTKSSLLFITMITFFIIVTTNWIDENSTLADGLSLISFALIIFDIVVRMYLEKLIINFNRWSQQLRRND